MRAPPSLATLCRSPGSNVSRGGRPAPAAAPPRLDARGSLDHCEPGTFAHLVVAELLAGPEVDDDRPRPVDGFEDCRQPGPLGRFDLRQAPGLHGAHPNRIPPP